MNNLIEEHPRGIAEYDETRRYRFTLRRYLDAPTLFAPPGRRLCNFVMLNPSTATAGLDDPTVRRCMSYALSWGFTDLIVTNIFALRSTDPSALYDEPDPVGQGNDEAILASARSASLVVCAWGNHGELRGRGAHVAAMLEGAGVDLNALAFSQAGQPGHPLYLPGYAEPDAFEAAAVGRPQEHSAIGRSS